MRRGETHEVTPDSVTIANKRTDLNGVHVDETSATSIQISERYLPASSACCFNKQGQQNGMSAMTASHWLTAAVVC